MKAGVKNVGAYTSFILLAIHLQDGINWLAFLNKYKLHGILCDDILFRYVATSPLHLSLPSTPLLLYTSPSPLHISLPPLYTSPLHISLPSTPLHPLHTSPSLPSTPLHPLHTSPSLPLPSKPAFAFRCVSLTALSLSHMGLGKTLQSLCIIASDHHNRKKQYEVMT